MPQRLDLGEDDGRQDPQQDAGDAADGREDQRFRDELNHDVAARRAERAPQPDLGSPLQDGDDHDVGDADATDEQCDGAKAQQQFGQRARRGGLGLQLGRGAAGGHLIGVLGVRGRRQGPEDRVDVVRVGADVDGARRVGDPEDVHRGGDADKRAAVEVRAERERVQDPDDREVLAADRHRRRTVEADNPERVGGGRTEHHDRVLDVRGVEEVPLGHRAVQGLEDVGIDGRHGQARGVLRRHIARAVHVDPSGDLLRHRLDVRDARDRTRGGRRQLGVPDPDAGLRLDLDEVGSERVDLVDQVRPARVAEPQDADDGGDSDGDADGRHD